MRSSQPNHAFRDLQSSPEKIRQRIAVKADRSLFSAPEAMHPGSLNDAPMVRSIVVDAMRSCTKSRAQIAEEMTCLAGVAITERMLNAFAAESREDHRFPSELERAFCVVVDDYRLLTSRAEAAGFHVIDKAGLDLMELGREFLRQKRAAAKIASLETQLAGVEL